MLTILIGIFIVIIYIVIAILLKFKEYTIINVAFLIFWLAIMLGIFYPIEGYNEAVFDKEVILLPIENVSDVLGYNSIYVIFSIEDTYTYKSEVKSKESGYTFEKISKESVTIIEQDNCEKPVLNVFKRKPKKGLFTFAIFAKNQYEYIFYIPKGTIIEMDNVNDLKRDAI